jgi:hypothetical protein
MTIANVTVASITLAILAKSRRWAKMAVMDRTLPRREGHILSKKDHVPVAQGSYKVIQRVLGKLEDLRMTGMKFRA